MRNKPAVILWLYHTDLSEEFTKVLFTHRNKIKLFLGLCVDNDNSRAETIFTSNFKNLDISYFNNGGTDILPTLKLLEKCATNHDIFFKLHSKKNNWGINRQVNWRSLLVNDIIYRDNFDFTVKKLERKDIGLVGSHSFIMRDNEYTNHNKILELCSLFNIDYNKLRLKSFIGGNVFAAKTKNFTPLLYNDRVKELLSQEVGLIKDDSGGTYVHSMERLFGYMAEYHNQTIYGGPHNTQIVLNTKLKKHRLHLVKIYNNNCYMQENPNVYGEIIQEDQYEIVINWLNVVEHPPQTYKKYPKYLLNTNAIT